MDVRQLALLAGQPSAAINNREYFWGMPKRGLAFLLANVMFWQPMWAQADGIVVASPGTSLGQAGNGVQIVNIATPNGTGLSHNQFHDYNVGTQGVILNNVANQTGATQLGGIIVGNPNLTNRVAAQTILNEVIGGSPSQLRGYTEVAGQSARVIVANPYGISCNGCGFINTPRVTLTTGKPVLDNGRLDRFQVDQGSVTIDGAGLNADNVDRFEIITRSAKINAEIQAKNLTIVAGRNDVNADSLNATARADDGSGKPGLAIDSSALGGMYAGAIKLVGTEAGVGVKLDGNLAASGGDIQLDANGHLSLAQASATGAVNVKAVSLDARGPVYAGTAVNVQTQGNLTNQQTLAARDSITLSAGGVLTNNGIIEAGVNADTSRNTSGDVSLSAQNLNNVGKSVVASRNLTVNTSQTLNNQGGTLSAAQTANITAGTLDNQNKGRVLSSGNLNLTASQVLNGNGLITSTGHLGATLGHLNNRNGELSSLASATLRMATLDNVAGLVNAGQALSITATGAVNNQGGKLTSLDSLSLTAGTVDNSNKGRIASNKALTASVSGLDQHDGGQLTSGTSLTLDLNHGELNNQNGLINAPVLVLKNLAQVDNRNGEISSAQAFTLAADSLDNSNGKLLGNQAVTLRIQQVLTNIKGLIAAASVDVQAGSLNNNGGTLTSRTGLDLRVTGQLDNQDQGLINATDNLTINTASLNNQNGGSLLGSAIVIDFSGAMGDLNNANGLITTTGQLSIRNLRDLNNQSGEISSSQSYALTARNLDNSGGKLISRQQLDLTADTTTNLKGLISGWQSLSLLGGSLDNRNLGTLSSRDGDVLVDLTGAVRNSNAGALVSNGTLKVTAASLDNSDNGILSSVGAQTFVIAGTLNNAQGGLIDSGAALDIRAKALDNTNATINAQQDISFTGTDLNNSTGTLAGTGAVTLDLLGTLTNTNGKLASNGPLVIQRAVQINNQGGQLASLGLLSLLTGGLDNRNGGIVVANDLLTLTASGFVQNSAGGQVFSNNAGLTLNAASLDNAKGTLQSEGDLTVKTSGAIDNQSGRIVAKGGNLDITAASLDSRGGVLSSLQGAFSSHITGVLRNGYDLNNNRRGGIIQAQSLNLKALAGIDNYGGRITAQTGDAIVDTGTNGNFDNRNGGLYAKGLVSVTAKDFDNSGDNDGQIGGQQIDLSLRGALNNRQGIIESESTLTISAASLDNQTGQLRALGDNGKTAFTLGGLFDNRNGTVESANTNLNLTAGSLLNVGGNVLHVGTGLFDIATGQLGSAGGNFVTRGGLTLTAASWTNSSVIQADRLTVNINSLNQTAAGQLLAASTLTGNGGNWNNDGLIASDGSLSLTLGGTYSGSGRVSSLGTFGLSAAQLNLNAASSLAGGGNTTISVGGQLSNAGRLTSAADLTLTAGSVNNTGTVGAGKNLTLTTDALRNDRGLIFSGADMQLLSPSFTNYYGQVYSLGSTLIARDKKGTKADLLDNRSGGIESTGDLTIAATTVNNVMDVLQYTEHEKSVATITQLSCTLISYGCDSRGGGRINGLWEIAETDRLKITLHSEAASINSGADLLINAGEVNNTSSSMTAAGDLAVHASTINNKGVQEQDIETTRRFVSWVNETASAIAMADLFTQRNNPTPSATVEQDMSNFLAWMGQTLPTSSRVINGESLDAIIQAGGNVTLDATQNINNSVVRPFYAYVAAGRTKTDTGAGSGYSTPIQINQQLAPDLAQQQVNPLTLPGFSLPTSQNGLFRLSQEGSTTPTATGPQSWTLTGASVTSPTNAPPITLNRVKGLPSNAGKSQPHKYLIETNPVLTDLKQFMSSDYLLSGLGYDPDKSAKRLGDGLYEQRLIQQAVVARTGQRFIDGQTTDEGLFKYLMNNAIASKSQLNLSLGVTLTSQQVAALTHDIVWLEEHEVNGEKVLVPVLYLANANNRLAANGALIQGSDVTLIAGKDLNNAGTLRASQNLDATAKNDLVSSGLLEAGDQLKVLATNNLTNKAGGIIAGRDVTLTATRGDVINERTVTTHESGTGYTNERTDFVNSAARIEAANALTLNAGRDVNNTGGVLKSGADTTINAGRDVNIASAEQIVSHEVGTHRDQTITQYGSDVDVGRDLKVNAGRDLTVIASQIDAKRDVSMSAVGDLTLASAADEQHSFSQNKKFTSQEDHVRQVSTTVNAGGTVSLKAGKDLGLIASRVSAGEEAYLVADGDLLVGAAQDEDYSFYSKTKKSSSGKKSQLQEISSTTNVGSSVTAQGKTVLSAGNDLLIEGSNVISEKGGVGLAAGNDVKIVAVTDSTSARFESSSSKSSWGGLKSSKVQDNISETQTTAVGSLISGNTIAVSAKRDVAITGSALVSTDDLAVRAGRDLNITAAENTYTRTESHKEKNRDLTGVLTANNLGVDDITGNQHLSISGQRHNGTMSQTTLTGSTIGSSNGNVSLVAGGDLSVIASDLISTKNMSLRGTNVTIAAGMESSSQSTADQSNSLAVGRVIGGAIIDTVNTIRTAVKAANDAEDPRLKAVKLAQAALAAYNLGGMAGDAEANSTGFKDKTGGTSNNGSLIKIGTELANTHSKSTSEYNSQTARQSSVNAGGTLSIIATGNAEGESGDIHVIGSTLKAADTSLIAKNDIILESAQNTAEWANNNSSNKTAIGASFNIGQQNGFTLDLGASGAKGTGTGRSITQVNSTLNTGSLLLRSGGDTTLAGAQVNADSINALIDGNLNIISRQDVEIQENKQGSGGFGASICIPPFCYGVPVSGSANLAAGNMNSEYRAVTDQTGLFAGSGGYTIDVGKNTTLTGGVIASDATPDKNLLITDRLIVSDIKNVSEIEAQSAGISASFSSAGGGSGSVGGLYGIALNDSDQSKTRSAVSEGTIIVRNPEGANDLVGLNRDTANANEQLDKPDQHAMDERIELVKSAMQLAQGIGDAIAAAKINEANDLNSDASNAARQKLNDKGIADPTPEQIAQQVQQDYGMGSSFQKASKAVSAIVQGVLSGNILGALAGASAPYLAQAVKQMTEGDDAANLMAHALLGAVLAKAQGGSALAGAAGATIGELIAKQLYPDKTSDQLTESEKQTVSALSTLAGGLAGAMVTGSSAGAALGAWTSKNAVENNHLSVVEQYSLRVAQREYEAACTGVTSSYCEGLSSDIADLIAKGSSVLKDERIVEESDFTRAFASSTKPGDIVSCVTSANGYCVATDKSITTDQGEEWILQPASYEQSIIGKNEKKLHDAELKARLDGVSNELFMAGCGGAGIVGVGCQLYTAFGGANPITGETATGPERVIWGVEALLNAWGLAGSVYSGPSKGVGTSLYKMPSELPDNLSGLANPKDIRFTQDSIKNAFADGGDLYSTIDGLKSGRISPNDIPPIRVFEKDGLVYSLDNRRLLAASAAGVPVKIIPATPAEIAKEGWKMTTPNNGSIICIRGVCR
ncbi:hemagglutinin repeat-containing protein [Pseudomonas sp. B21-015]|uniref:two-partner secretion domain-containing protein n=1 Tax=Pseudomonas sp. B21-015 TaxID=2895473 RepID=UPI00215E8D40|nr:hemagglutinin repeat-containing protein [Pseudomonas sp. B21-015]UVM49024.1 hemagglutinin repeat-containing protein [Pseudomonas sp. B21-015]